jgi:phosphatidylglycerophosphate synthase
MFDARIRASIDPVLDRLGGALARRGVRADHLTLAGAAAGLAAGGAIAWGETLLGLALILVSRLFDGLDGAVARASAPTDFGAYLDSLCDFLFYLAVPLGFAVSDRANLPFALALVSSFTLTAVSFLAYAAISEKRGNADEARGAKGFVYSPGLAEGGETIIVFILMCLIPSAFPALAAAFTGLCALTVVVRTWQAWRILTPGAGR